MDVIVRAPASAGRLDRTTEGSASRNLRKFVRRTSSCGPPASSTPQRYTRVKRIFSLRFAKRLLSGDSSMLIRSEVCCLIGCGKTTAFVEVMRYRSLILGLRLLHIFAQNRNVLTLAY